MEKYVIGKFKKIIYENNESNFRVTLFRLEETIEKELNPDVGSLIHITGVMPNLRLDQKYKVYG